MAGRILPYRYSELAATFFHGSAVAWRMGADMSAFGAAYRQLAIDNFQPQMIADIEDTDRVMEVCQQEMADLGYPCHDENEDDWLEFVYAATEMWQIVHEGFVYRSEPNPAKRGGREMVLYTRVNHPAFSKEWAENNLPQETTDER